MNGLPTWLGRDSCEKKLPSFLFLGFLLGSPNFALLLVSLLFLEKLIYGLLNRKRNSFDLIKNKVKVRDFGFAHAKAVAFAATIFRFDARHVPPL
jgi:hypothetical protein